MLKRLKVKFITSILILALLFTVLSPAITVWAIDPPDSSPSVIEVNVYRDCLEEDDQLYLIFYYIEYAATPTETIDEAYLFRLMNGATELKTAVAFPYNDDGYNYGVAAIYFSADEIADKAMVWEGAYTVNILGNPTLTWTGTGCPDIDCVTFTAWNDPMGLQLGYDVMAKAIQLTYIWGGFSLYESISGSVTLSEYGELYFGSTIPYLMGMQPDIFRSSSEQIGYYDRTYTQTYATSIDYTYWSGTWLDLTDVATGFNIDASYLYGAMWIIIILCGAVCCMLLTADTALTILIVGLLLIFGSLLHFMPLTVTILGGVVMATIIFYWLFYRSSYG